MSTLPSIDPNKVSQRLLTKASEYLLQTIQLEILAEALRDERDGYQSELSEARDRVRELEQQVEAVPSSEE